MLRSIGWLSNCPAEIQSAMYDIATVLRLEADVTVYELGGEPGGFFGIEAGCVAFEAGLSSSAPQKGLLLHAGCWFGEVVLYVSQGQGLVDRLISWQGLAFLRRYSVEVLDYLKFQIQNI